MTEKIKIYLVKAKMGIVIGMVVFLTAFASWASTYYVMADRVEEAEWKAMQAESWASAVEDKAMEVIEELESRLYGKQ